jgi:hypothetical protein
MREEAATIQADLMAAVAMLRRLLAAVDPAWVTAAAAAAGVLVALVAAITGLRSLRQLRADSRERSRPMMAAELRKPPYTRGTQLLVIRNYGPSIARNVEVTFDPPIAEPIPERAAESVSPFITRRYAKPIPVVTPGMELANIWFSGRLEGNEWVNFERTPPQFTVTIAYDGPDGFPYKDSFPWTPTSSVVRPMCPLRRTRTTRSRRSGSRSRRPRSHSLTLRARSDLGRLTNQRLNRATPPIFSTPSSAGRRPRLTSLPPSPRPSSSRTPLTTGRFLRSKKFGRVDQPCGTRSSA